MCCLPRHFKNNTVKVKSCSCLRVSHWTVPVPLLCMNWTSPPCRGMLKNQLNLPPWAKLLPSWRCLKKKKIRQILSEGCKGYCECSVIWGWGFCCDAALALYLLPLRAVSTAITTARWEATITPAWPYQPATACSKYTAVAAGVCVRCRLCWEYACGALSSPALINSVSTALLSFFISLPLCPCSGMFDDGVHTYLIEPLQQTHPIVSYSHVIAAEVGRHRLHHVCTLASATVCISHQRSMLMKLQIEPAD